MAYTSGDTILDDHYNDFATSVNAIWGSGSGDKGYGQTNTVSKDLITLKNFSRPA